AGKTVKESLISGMDAEWSPCGPKLRSGRRPFHRCPRGAACRMLCKQAKYRYLLRRRKETFPPRELGTHGPAAKVFTGPGPARPAASRGCGPGPVRAALWI